MLNNQKRLFLLIFGVFVCFFPLNYEIQRITKHPFNSILNHHKQIFKSPLNIIFLTSALIWFYTYMSKFILQDLCNVSPQKLDLIEQQKQPNQQYFENILKTKTHKQSKHDKQFYNQLHPIDNLSYIQILKLIIPKFIQIFCFFYSLKYLSFPQVLIISIFIKLGLFALYQVFFTEISKKITKFILALLVLLSFGLFMQFFQQDLQKQIQSNYSKTSSNQKIYGYMYAIVMCYSGVMKNIVLRQVIEQCGQINHLDIILIQSKANFIIAYIFSVYLDQQIDGCVFAVLHPSFIWSFIGLSLFYFFGMLIKGEIKKNQPQLQHLIIILQNNLSVIISFYCFDHKINLAVILSVSLLFCILFFKIYQEFIFCEQTFTFQQINKFYPSHEKSHSYQLQLQMDQNIN